LRVVLLAGSGQITVPQAAAQLGIGPTRFHELRNELLQHALESAEPKARGRPAKHDSPAEVRIRQLEQEVQSLKLDLRAAQIRQELEVILPHVVRRGPAVKGGEKKDRRRPRTSG
jgi:predicted ArsR family transcriptional regulator